MKPLRALISKTKISNFSNQDYLYVIYPYTIPGCNEIDRYTTEYTFVLGNDTTCFICTKRQLKELDKEVLTPKAVEYRLYIAKNNISRETLEDTLYHTRVPDSEDLIYLGYNCISMI